VRWTPGKARRGAFGDRVVQGVPFTNEAGRTAWHIMTWPSDDSPIDDYWYEAPDFFEILRIDYAVNLRPENHFETGGKIIEMDRQKETNLRQAIREWEESEAS
jgi:hypothetical protein